MPYCTREERAALLEDAHYNLFAVPASAVSIDLLTDSGTGAMSAAQWSAVATADESYAGAQSFEQLQTAVREITGFKHLLPTHQGRAAERLLFRALVKPGDVVAGNGHFDTTRANIEALGARAIDVPVAAAWRASDPYPTKGDFDLDALRELVSRERVPVVLATLTSNRAGGQPISLDNLRAVAALCRATHTRLFLDVARFAENAALAKLADPALASMSPAEIARAFFDLADGCTMSAKKDGLVNIGGFIALRDGSLADKIVPSLVLEEGFTSYGGLAGRDLAALAVGLREALEPRYLEARLRSVRTLADELRKRGIPLVEPTGGHAVYVDAGRLLPHIAPGAFPGQALACALYVEGGVRTCEMGTLMFGDADRNAPSELVRFALPRRVYSDEHLLYVANVAARVVERAGALRGLRVVASPPTLRHFLGRYAPL